MFHVKQIPYMESRTILRDASAEIQNLMFSKDERDELNPGRKSKNQCLSLTRAALQQSR